MWLFQFLFVLHSLLFCWSTRQPDVLKEETRLKSCTQHHGLIPHSSDLPEASTWSTCQLGSSSNTATIRLTSWPLSHIHSASPFHCQCFIQRPSVYLCDDEWIYRCQFSQQINIYMKTDTDSLKMTHEGQTVTKHLLWVNIVLHSLRDIWTKNIFILCCRGGHLLVPICIL